jgi:phosphonopyruvate decarboxylase
VVAVDGDGAALMRMGVFATLGAYGPANLTHVLLDNNAHESTGGQATVSHNVSFAGVAAACGYASAIEGDTSTCSTACWPARPRPRRPEFRLPADRAGTPDGLPRPTVTPVEVKTRLAARSAPTQATLKERCMLLLNPGPVTLSERAEPAATDLCHRESEFFDLQDEARAAVDIYELDPPNGRPC